MNALEKLNVDQQINALATDGKNLYVAGKIEGYNVAKWDGKKWGNLTKDKFENSAGSPAVMSLAWHNGKLFAGGYFQTIGDEPCSNIAKWEGAKWQAIGNGIGKKVTSIALDGETIYAAAGGNVFKWDGKTWSELPEIQYASIKAVAVLNGTLYAGGLFDGGQFQGICKFSNGKWEAAYQ